MGKVIEDWTGDWIGIAEVSGRGWVTVRAGLSGEETGEHAYEYAFTIKQAKALRRALRRAIRAAKDA